MEIQKDDRWIREVTAWYPRNRKRKGEDKQHDRDNTVKIACVIWGKKAQNKKQWKTLEEAFVLQQTKIG